MQITVIIPTLNSIEYIEMCMYSIMNQTCREIEILVVDAGSTDGTIDVIEELQKQDTRIRLIHSNVRSYGAQVNLGIDNANGKYIAIVESDDYIEKTMLEELLRIAEDNEAEYVKGNFYDTMQLENGDRLDFKSVMFGFDRYDEVIKPMDHPELYIKDIYLWRGIYNKAFLINNNIRLNQSKGAAYQDIGFLYQVFLKANRAVYVKKAYYQYTRNNLHSSTYCKKAFQYLAGEYSFLEQLCLTHPREFESYFYFKLYQQLYYRIRLMAISGEFWSEAQSDIDVILKYLTDACKCGKMDPGIFGTEHWLEAQMMMEDIQKYYQYQEYLTCRKQQVLHKYISEAKSYRHIVLMTCSKLNEYVYGWLKLNGVDNIVAFADNDSDKWDKKRIGIDVMPVENATEKYTDALYIVGNNHYSPDMRMQLQDAGIQAANILVYNMGMDWQLLIDNMAHNC